MSDKMYNNFNKNFNKNFYGFNEMPRIPESEVSSESTDSQMDGEESQLSLTLPGCGFNSFYYLGVVACLQKYHQINDKTIICGASSGALAGLAVCLDLPLEKSTALMIDFTEKIMAKPMGILQPSCDLHQIIHDNLVKILPDNCHKRVSGRLYISVTRVSDGQNVLISQFNSKADLIKAIQCSSFMPFLSGISPPRYKGTAYIDGAFSNNAPKVNKDSILVSPWSGEFDICPLNDTSLPNQVMFYSTLITLSPLNLYRMTQIPFPPNWNVISTLCAHGFDDTLRFLFRTDRIGCDRCLTSPVMYSVSEDDSDEDRQSDDSGYDHIIATNNELQFYYSDTNCRDCQYILEVAVNDSLPETMIKAIDESRHQSERKLLNRLSKHRFFGVLLMLFLPFLFLFEIIIALVSGVFLKDWSFSQLFKDIMNISRIFIANGLVGRQQQNS